MGSGESDDNDGVGSSHIRSFWLSRVALSWRTEEKVPAGHARHVDASHVNPIHWKGENIDSNAERNGHTELLAFLPKRSIVSPLWSLCWNVCVSMEECTTITTKKRLKESKRHELFSSLDDILQRENLFFLPTLLTS